MANAEKVEKVTGKQDSNEAYAIRKLGKLVRGLLDILAEKYLGDEEILVLEKETGVDLNKDGKIGSSRLAVLAVIAGIALVGSVFAGENQFSLPRVEDDSLNTFKVDSDGTVQIVANEDTDATIILESDQGDDNADTWKIYVDADDSDTVKIATYTSGSYADVFELTTAGALTTISVASGGTNYGGDITLENDEVIENGTDGTVSVSVDGTAEDLIFYTYTAKQNGTVTWKSLGDNGDDAGDTFGIENDGAGNLTIQSDASAKGTLADKVIITSAGKVTVADDLTVSGGDIEGGAATLTLGKSAATRVEIADTTIITDIEGPLSAAETAAFIGVATFTAQPIFNGGVVINEDIDIDLDAADEEIVITQSSTAHTEATPMITISDSATGATATETDEATVEITSAGVYALSIPDGAVSVEGVIDADGATLSLGPTIATAVEIGASGIDTTILGPLNVLEATGKGIDTTGGGALYLGEVVATSVVLGATDANTTVAGDLIIGSGDIKTDAGDALTISATADSGAGAGNNLTLAASAGTTTGAGGAAAISGGAGAGAGAAGGAVTALGGDGAGTGNGGAATLGGGGGGAGVQGDGGAVDIHGGAGGVDGNGGAVAIYGGSSAGGNEDGGAVTITAGDKNGTGNDGLLTLKGGTNIIIRSGGTVQIANEAGTGDAALLNIDATATTISGTLAVTGETSVDGKYAVVGPDATTPQMVLAAAVTSTGTTMTNTFATVFGAAPIVTLTYTESATTELYLGTVTASNFISFHESSKNYAYIAVGQRP